MQNYSILVVDDDPLILRGLGQALESQHYRVTPACSGEKAVELLSDTAFDLVITDLIMEAVDGIKVLKQAKRLNRQTAVIILTGHGELQTAIDALRLNADDYLLKPCENEELYFRITRCLEKLELQRKIKSYEDILPVCCICKKIRDDAGKEPGSGNWMSLENYIRTKTKIEVTSTYCPECACKIIEELRCR